LAVAVLVRKISGLENWHGTARSRAENARTTVFLKYNKFQFLFIIYLGSDRVQVCLANKKYNEIKQYLQGRYISVSEAA